VTKFWYTRTGVCRAEYRHGTAELDLLGDARDGGEHDLGRGRRHVGAMMLTNAVDIQAQFVGELGFLDHLPEPSPRRQARVVDLCEGGQTKFHLPHATGPPPGRISDFPIP
jgi:hypothetical protein